VVWDVGCLRGASGALGEQRNGTHEGFGDGDCGRALRHRLAELPDRNEGPAPDRIGVPPRVGFPAPHHLDPNAQQIKVRYTPLVERRAKFGENST
jgi:hypothetical protein